MLFERVSYLGSKFIVSATIYPSHREVLRQALADAVYYRDPPVVCDPCEAVDGLCPSQRSPGPHSGRTSGRSALRGVCGNCTDSLDPATSRVPAGSRRQCPHRGGSPTF